MHYRMEFNSASFGAVSLADFVKAASVSFVALFPLVNPLGSAPIFLSLTKHYPRDVQRTLARKVSLYGLMLLLSSLVVGVKILAFLGISLGVVQAAGGVIIAHTGWQLLTSQSSDTAANHGESLQAALTQAFYPLTLPLTVGPGSISIAITMAAHLKQGEGFEMLIAAAAGMAALCAVVWLVYDRAHRLEEVLGKTGTEVLNRLSAFALFALGLQVTANGVMTILGGGH